MCKLVVGQHYSLYDRSSFGKTVCKLKLPTTSCEHANNNNNDNVLSASLLLILLLLLCIISLCGDEVRMCGLPQDQDDTTTKTTIVNLRGCCQSPNRHHHHYHYHLLLPSPKIASKTLLGFT